MEKWSLQTWWRTRKNRAQPQKERSSYIGDGKCCDFNLYIGGTKEDGGTKVTGVEKVALPKPEKGKNGWRETMTMRLEVDTLEHAAALLKQAGKWQRVEVRAAVAYLEPVEGYGFHGHQYIMDVLLAKIDQIPLERDKGTAVSITFTVRAYTVYIDAEKVLEIGAEDQNQ